MKKTQIKIGETIGVIVITYLILFFSYTWYSKNDFKNKLEGLKNDALTKAYLNYYFVVNHPLLKKTEEGIIDKQSVFEKYSLLAFHNFTKKNKVYYYSKLGNSLIYLECYNFTGDDFEKIDNIVLYNYSLENFNRNGAYVGREVFFNLVNLYDPKTDNTYLAMLYSITYYKIR